MNLRVKEEVLELKKKMDMLTHHSKMHPSKDQICSRCHSLNQTQNERRWLKHSLKQNELYTSTELCYVTSKTVKHCTNRMWHQQNKKITVHEGKVYTAHCHSYIQVHKVVQFCKRWRLPIKSFSANFSTSHVLIKKLKVY